MPRSYTLRGIFILDVHKLFVNEINNIGGKTLIIE